MSQRVRMSMRKAVKTMTEPAIKRPRKRRHPAKASRQAAAVVSTAATFALIAVLGGKATASPAAAPAVAELAVPTTTSSTVPVTAPEPVVVVRRTYVPRYVTGSSGSTSSSSSGSTRSSSSGSSSSQASSAPASAPQAAPPVTAAPRSSAPVARSSAS